MPDRHRPRAAWRAVVVGSALLTAPALAQDTAPSAPPSPAAPSTPSSAAPSAPSLFRDPKDGAFDVSGWLATRTGVLPVPFLITEPAVGYGGGLALVNFRGGGLANAIKAPPGPSGRPVPPDIAAVGGALTENGTWAALAGYIGHFREDRWRYKGAVARISPNLDYYGSDDRAYRFNLDGWAVYQELARRVGRSDVFAGMQFAWLDTTTTFDLPGLPPGLSDPQADTTESGLGAFVEYDTRDNSLTPSRGINAKASAAFLGPYLGGDHTFQRYTARARFWWDPDPRLVLWTRLQWQSVSGDTPFYALPFIYLRGVPVMRYQGEAAYAVDVEAKWNVYRRWWLVGFAGSGWTDDAPGFDKEDASVSAGGLGFRYLVASALGLQTGVDVAKGPEQYALYIVVGSTF